MLSLLLLLSVSSAVARVLCWCGFVAALFRCDWRTQRQRAATTDTQHTHSAGQTNSDEWQARITTSAHPQQQARRGTTRTQAPHCAPAAACSARSLQATVVASMHSGATLRALVFARPPCAPFALSLVLLTSPLLRFGCGAWSDQMMRRHGSKRKLRGPLDDTVAYHKHSNRSLQLAAPRCAVRGVRSRAW